MEVKSPVEVQVRNPLALVRVRNPLPAIPNPVAWVTSPVAGALDDLRKIARGMDALPELVRVLTVIQAQTQSLDQEVRSMRAEVSAVNTRLDSMANGVAPLGDKLDEVADSLQPIRRALRRLKRSKPASSKPTSSE